MTRVARHFSLAIEVCLIDCKRNLNHFPRGLLGGFIVQLVFTVYGDMAVIAIDP